MKNSKIYTRRSIFLHWVFTSVCLISLGMIGCSSQPEPVSVAPEKELLQPENVSNSGDYAPVQKLSSFDENSGNNGKAVNPSASSTHADPVSSTAKAELSSLKAPAVINKPETHPIVFTDTAVNLPVLENKPGLANELISVNFDKADIRMVIKTISDITGINFVVDESVNGNITVMSPTKIRLGELYTFLESILEIRGYAAVPAGNIVKIVPRANAAQRNLQVRIGADPTGIPQNDSLVTQILPLQYADAAEVSQIINPLLAPGSNMAVYPKTNSIMITDISSNIRHIAKIIQNLDVQSSNEQTTVIPLQYASSQVISEQLNRLMQNNFSGSVPSGRGQSPTAANVKIMPDTRTNSVIVVANATNTQKILDTVKELDIEQPSRANNVHVIYLKNAPAKETAQSLTAALTNLRITGTVDAGQSVKIAEDEGTNALIVTASAQDYEVIAGIVEKLDIVREQVLVEMLIIEVSEDSLKEIGVDWATLDASVEGSARGFAATNFGPRVDFASGDLEGLAVGAWKGTGSNLRIGTILHALEKQSGVNILSTPHIMTSNHQKAKIIVGENIPFVMQSRITEDADPLTPTVIKTFEYKDVGISLEITPHISQGGYVRLEISSEFTKLIDSVTTSGSTDTPTTAKREAQTIVGMNSGSTVVIGGLIRDDKVSSIKKVPLLGDIPLVGGLFRLERDRIQKTNLLMFITPHVMNDQIGLDQMTSRKKQEIQPALEDSKNSGAKVQN